MDDKRIIRRIKIIIIVFIVFLTLSGITAFPIETELQILNENGSIFPDFIAKWLADVYLAVKDTNTKFPFLSYGTDWLAFAHLVIAVAFIGPLKNPVKNIWVIEFGIIACLMVIPLALIAGVIRGIPFYWRLIDCSFGILGLIPLIWCYKLIKKLEVNSKPN
ncbi:hypothetical protein [Flavobacterium sp.]|uniref:hypothetical protein n=1 Tax=Flavobacterium sp. TaxID=239 RepID=UPI00286D76B4|nr:hypothetical protein [Flavobacterium sp.]